MNNEMVSIIMPVYNGERYIGTSIESVLSQTYLNWELLIINDNSNDKTKQIVKGYQKKDSRIKIYNLKTNNGVANARNIGIENSRGKYIAFLDSDDIWLSEKLEKQIQFMKENNYKFTFHLYRHFKDEKVSNKLIKAPYKLSYNDALKGNVIGCLTVCIDAESVKKVIMPLARHEDYITWLNVLRENNICAYGLQEDLARYRIGDKGSVSGNKLKSALWTWQVYRESQKLNLLKSIYYFTNYFKNGIQKYW